MKNILTLENASAMVDFLQSTLAKKGYNFFPSANEKEALKTLNKEDINLVMLEAQETSSKNFAAFKRLKEQKGKDLSVLFLATDPDCLNVSSKQIKEIWEHDFSDGSTDIIYKPFDLLLLYEKVEALIGTPA